MSSRRRQSKTIGFKAFYDDDADILEWWERMPEGERSQVLRDLIRAALMGQADKPRANGHTTAVKGQELAQVCEDTTWIRNALSDLPSYLERLMSQVVVTRPVLQVEPPDDVQDEGPRLEQDAIERRKTKMRQNVW